MAPNFLHRTASSGSHRTLSSFIASTISRSGSPDPKAPIISSAKPVEEETLPKYSPQTFYPAKIGEKLHEHRYEIVAKLGYGMTATVWLARDLHAPANHAARKYVTIKINVNTLTGDFLKGRREIAEKLMKTDSKHPGYSHVRFMLDTFTLKGKHGDHLCIVYDVLREPIDECQSKFSQGVFSSDKLRKLLPALLQGLDYMHDRCHVVHTDLKADNIMMGLGDDPNGVLDRFVLHQQLHPTPRKTPDGHDGHVIYKSSSDLLLVGDQDRGESVSDAMVASAKITDIGLAEWGDRGLQYKPIQSNAFTCPEVLLGAGWSYPADIWNLGVMIWDLIETQGLFDHISTAPGKYHANEHLALMICLLGPPPKALLDRGLKTCNYFNFDKDKEEWVFKSQKLVDKWKDQISFENAVTHMQGENKESFIDFAKKMIAWLPEERWTAAQLLEHPWLKARPGTVTSTCQDFEEASRKISMGLQKDAELERQRQSAAVSIASSSQYTDGDECLSDRGLEMLPKQGISQRSTNTSLMSVDEMKAALPSPVSTSSK